MDKIKNFLKYNQGEVISLLSLFFVFVLLYILTFNRLASLIVDCGREAYFPELVLQGKVLYKDMFNLFGPFSYQMNALFYYIFGVQLSSLYVAGGLNAFLITFLLYAIARFYTDYKTSLALTFFITITCAFSPWIFNFVFPYAFALPYAFSAFLASLLFLLWFLKTDKMFLVPISWFFAGVSIASKYEYFLYVIFLLMLSIFAILQKKINLKQIAYSFIAFSAPLIICFSILFHQGLTFENLIQNSIWIKNHSISTSVTHFYSNYAGIYPQKHNILTALKYFAIVFSSMLVFFIATYNYLKTGKENIKNSKKVIFSLLLTLFSFFILTVFIRQKSYVTLSWLPILSLAVFIYALVQFTKEKSLEENKTYLIFFTVALLASAKNFFFLNLQIYGTYSLPLLLIADSIFVVEHLPNKYLNINQNLLKKTLFIMLLSISMVFATVSFASFSELIPVKTKKGILYNPNAFASPVGQAIDYIEKNSKKEDSLWILPEGVMINFLTNRPSNNIYYNTLPSYIETFGESNILKSVKANPPEYVILNNRDSIDYGNGYLCKDYGFEICRYIHSSYKEIKTFDNIFKLTLYKKINSSF